MVLRWLRTVPIERGTPVVITVPEASPTLNQIKGLHHQAYKRLRDGWAWKIKAALMKMRYHAPVIEFCFIDVERWSYHSSAKKPDWDGLYGGLKPVLDCLVVVSKSSPSGLGVIRDDDPYHIMSLTAEPYLAAKGENKTVITITPLITEQEET